MRIKFELMGHPRAKGRPRFSRQGQRVYSPPATRKAERAARLQAAPHAPPEALEGPLVLHLEFYFPIPRSWPKWKKAAAAEGKLRHASKPDVDNLAKLVKDALNGLLWRDDAQVQEVRAAKYYTEGTPRTHVAVKTLPQASRQ